MPRLPIQGSIYINNIYTSNPCPISSDSTIEVTGGSND